MSHLNDIIDQVTFRDELSTDTKYRQMSAAPEIEDSFDDDDSLNFNLPKRSAPAPAAPEPEDDDYDAEANAQSLVYLMSSLDTVILNGIGMWKVNAKAGGRKALSEMKEVLLKELASVELTDEEKTLMAKFKEYKANMKLLETETPPSQAEIDRLIQMAIPYCESSRIKVGGGFAFWTGYGASLASRIIKIINL
jgi:hypothetical protein